ncbi:hypothetical protein [Aneurinibacillus terranovensis]|uniref:hypothetical protein n=1 Tax=Aneurinibacillus terranovensis TaxID=278991 RepID=UPI000423F501
MTKNIPQGYVKLQHYFLDGTKIEADANRYTFVWKKAVKQIRKDFLSAQRRQ